MKKYISINIFENEKYRIQKVKDNFKDKFEIMENKGIITIKRIDKNEGWGANLSLKIFDKVNFKEYIKTIGASNNNIVKIEIENIKSINHYENNFFKLYTISTYNDIFKIKYDEMYKNLELQRLDASIGWDQDLIVEYFDKITENIKHIKVGPSKENTKIVIVDFNKEKNIDIPNIYKDTKIKIEKIQNEYNDSFIFSFDHKSFILKVKREDVDEGWGQNLMVNIDYNNKSYNIYIGPSNANILLKKIKLKEVNVYVCLTTIPSRFSILLNNLKHFVSNQNESFEKILITIPKKYKRFKENIDNKLIELLKKIEKVEIINIEEDWGPASKYLGPLIHYPLKKDDLLVIIDDDRIYNSNLIKHFKIAYLSFYDYEFYSGLWSYFFDKNYKFINPDFLELSICKEKNIDNFKFGNGLGGFFGFGMHLKNKKEFINYHFSILDKIKTSFFHDEGIILGYLKKKEKIIIYLKHLGCKSYEQESVDALCKSGLCDRSKVEKEILYITNYQLLL